MAYPPIPSRHLSYRQKENAGLPLDTAALDGEMVDVMACIEQLALFVRLLAAADGTLKNQFVQAFSAFAGQQVFTATSGQTQFDTLIPYTSQMTNLTLTVHKAGLVLAPSTYTVSAYTANSVSYCRITLTTGATSGQVVIVNAFDSQTTQNVFEFTATASQSIYVTTIPFSSDFTSSTVDVYTNGTRVAPSSVTISSSSGGMLQATISGQAVNTKVVIVVKGLGVTILQRLADVSSIVNGANMVGIQDLNAVYGATTVEGALYEIRFLFNQLVSDLGAISDLWTKAGESLGGSEASADFKLGGFKIINLADGVDDTDAVTVQQVKALTQNLADVLGLFVRKDGTVPFEADQSMGDHLLVDLAPGVADTDAVNKKQMVDADAAVATAAATALATADKENLKRNGSVKLTGHWQAGDPEFQFKLNVAPGTNTIAIYKNGSPTALVKDTDWSFDTDTTKIKLLAPQLPLAATDTFVLTSTTLASVTTTLVQDTDWWLIFRQIKGVMAGVDDDDVVTMRQLAAAGAQGTLCPTSESGPRDFIHALINPESSVRVSRVPASTEMVVASGTCAMEVHDDIHSRSATVGLGSVSVIYAAGVPTHVRLAVAVQSPGYGGGGGALITSAGVHLVDVPIDGAEKVLVYLHVDHDAHYGTATFRATATLSGDDVLLTLRGVASCHTGDGYCGATADWLGTIVRHEYAAKGA